MELKKLFTEDRAVSPVIAVVLMIAVTVILAAVVAAFALGLGGTAEQTPQATFDFEYDAASDNVIVTHEGGDTLPRSQVTVYVNGANSTTTNGWTADPITTGVSYTAEAVDAAQIARGDEVRVRWQGEDGQTATLAEYTVPEN